MGYLTRIIWISHKDFRRILSAVDKQGAARYHMGNFIKTVDAVLNTDVDRTEEESLENLIELSAEGARRKPNLSGKRTEDDSVWNICK